VSVALAAAAVAALVWAARMRPRGMARDGSWFDCDYQVVEREPSTSGAGRWRAGRGELVDDRVLLRVGPFARAARFGDPLPVLQRNEAARRGFTVYVLGQGGTVVAVAVARGSVADRRLAGLVSS